MNSNAWTRFLMFTDYFNSIKHNTTVLFFFTFYFFQELELEKTVIPKQEDISTCILFTDHELNPHAS